MLTGWDCSISGQDLVRVRVYIIVVLILMNEIPFCVPLPSPLSIVLVRSYTYAPSRLPTYLHQWLINISVPSVSPTAKCGKGHYLAQPRGVPRAQGRRRRRHKLQGRRADRCPGRLPGDLD